MSDCLFCKMTRGDIPVDKLYENDHVLAFHDIRPQAPTHFLVIPKMHIETLDAMTAEQGFLVGEMYLAAAEIARDLGVSEQGYRSVINCKDNGGQTVYHIHLHVLGGRAMHWPPG